MYCYQLLAAAIVRQAADDYIQLLTGIGGSPAIPPYSVAEIKAFFRSRWFGTLCGLDPDYLLEQLNAKAGRMSALRYAVSKEKRGRRYYVHKIGEPDVPIPGCCGTRTEALRAAAALQGVRYRDYMQMRRKEGANLDKH